MAARKKQEQEINLLPQKGFQTSTAGRILAWILSTFRIIVIVTEIIVMIAFLSRFWFDAQNTDLNEKIEQKQAVLIASQDFERRFEDLQKRLVVYTKLTSDQDQKLEVVKTVGNSIPSDVILRKIVVEKNSLELTALTSNEKSIQQVIVNLGTSQNLKNVGLSGLKSDPENPTILIFEIKASTLSEKEGA